MITEVKLDNWKSFSAAALHVDPLSVLIGTNSSGKSNSLDALTFLNRTASGSLLTAALQGDNVQSAIRGGLELAPRRPGNTFSLEVTFRVDETTDLHYSLQAQIADKRCDVGAEYLRRVKYRPGRRAIAGEIKLFRTDPCSPESPTITVWLYNEKRGVQRQLGRSQSILFQLLGQKLRQEIQDGVAEAVSTLRDIFILDPIPSHMRAYSTLSDRLESDASNIAGVIAALPPERKQEIEKSLTRYASKLPEKDITRVYAETVGRFGADAMLYSEEGWPSSDPFASAFEDYTVVDARGMSDGTLRFLAILTAMLTRPKGSLLVVEEVDNGLHPSRANLLLDMLRTVGKERGVDVLVTTHNPALLDAMGTEMVPFITVAHRDVESGASILTLLEDVRELPKLLARGPVGRISSQGLLEHAFTKSAELVGVS